MFIEMKVAGIILDPSNNVPVLILKDRDERYTVPIWIGIVEASAIATELEKTEMPRPMTHDLLRNVLRELGATVERIEVTELRDNTFFAAIHLRTAAGPRVLDSRPSDAVALALRVSAPIFVEERVIAQLGSREEEQEAPKPGKQPRTGPVLISNLDPADRFDKEKWAEFLESLDPEDFGKYKM
jgi:bifunctional DNase/RNase